MFSRKSLKKQEIQAMGDEGDAIIQSYSISLMAKAAKTATIFALFLARSKNLGQEHVSPSHYITFPSLIKFSLCSH